MYRHSLGIVLLILACGKPNKPDLSGTWSICMTNASSQSTCGGLTARPPERITEEAIAYPSTYQLNLRAILESANPPASRCAVLVAGGGGYLDVRIGLPCGSFLDADAGTLYTGALSFAGDSLVGTWYQNCPGCSAHGRITLKRRR